jgi:hypothetical protein
MATVDDALQTKASGFPPDQAVLVQQDGDKNWIVMAPLSYTGQNETFHVPLEMLTDFASVPRPFVWLLPRYGRWTKAAIVHDYLWRQAVPLSDGRLSLRQADAIFRRAMRELDVAFLRRWFMWTAVRWGALTKPGGWKHWWKDAWQILPLTVLAIPIVGPPAVVVIAGLLVFYAVELVVWLLLNLLVIVKPTYRARPHKQVNKPSLLVKL